MKKFTMFVFAVTTLCVAPLAAAQVAADRLSCRGGEMQVCTTPDADGAGFKVLTDGRGRARTDCDVSQPRGVDLRCVAESNVRAAEEVACRELGGSWRWSRRHERCYQHVSPRESEGDNNRQQPPVVVSLRCSDADRARYAAELDRIWNDRLVVEDFGPLQLRAVEVYSLLLGCDDGTPTSRRLIDLAANMVGALNEPGPDYTGEFNDLRRLIVGLQNRPVEVTVEVHQENWCTDTHEGRFTCIALPILVGIAAAIAIPVIYDYLDDGSPNGIIRW